MRIQWVRTTKPVKKEKKEDPKADSKKGSSAAEVEKEEETKFCFAVVPETM